MHSCRATAQHSFIEINLMAEQEQPRDALVARVVERLGAAVGADDVAVVATVLRDVPALATNVKLTVRRSTH